MHPIKKLSLIHPSLEGRRQDVANGLYPRQHLWGVEEIEKDQSWSSKIVETQNVRLHHFLERILNRFLFRRSPGVKTEIACWRAAQSSDLIYSVCGPLSLSRFYQRAKLISWVFRMPQILTKQAFDPYSSKNLNSHSAFLCLTPDAERSFSKHSLSKFLPWCVDLELFDGRPPKEKPDSDFFLATGKTGRDYQTLIDGAAAVSTELRIIGPEEQRPKNLPSNVKWLNTTEDPPDQAIDYPTLREWYAQCLAICIPLCNDAEDTCGYTNMLEGMAMAKPVLMTSSGCLHINPGDHEFGVSIQPEKASAWTSAMKQILDNPDQAKRFGKNGRKIAAEELSVSGFDRKVVDIIHEIID